MTLSCCARRWLQVRCRRTPTLLTGRFVSSGSKEIATIKSWEDLFRPEEYANGWDYRKASEMVPKETIPPKNKAEFDSFFRKRRLYLEPLEEDTGLDCQSRHLLRQMQLLYQDGQEHEEVTVRRCKHMMNLLFESARSIMARLKSNQDLNVHGPTLARQRVLRAEAILRTMELFWDFIPNDYGNDRDNAKQRNFYHFYYGQERPPCIWPVPTYDMYVHVTRALDSLRFPKQYHKLDNSDIPWICQDVVERLHRFHSIKGKFANIPTPSIEDWNQVLSCWANAHAARDHPEKAQHATQLLMDMTLRYNVAPDASCYTSVLRACAHHDENAQARELGAKLAVELWKGILQVELRARSIAPTPHLFVFLMRALASHDADGEEELDRDRFLAQAWEHACDAGVVNEHVLYELEQASIPLFHHLLRSYRNLVDTHPLQSSLPGAYDKTYHRQLLRFLPPEWSQRVKRD